MCLSLLLVIGFLINSSHLKLDCQLHVRNVDLLLLQAWSWIVLYDRDIRFTFWADYPTRDYYKVFF